jgi:hypothetical protein
MSLDMTVPYISTFIHTSSDYLNDRFLFVLDFQIEFASISLCSFQLHEEFEDTKG